jgi:hypothetical protein
MLSCDQFLDNQIKPIKRPFEPTKEIAWDPQMIGMAQCQIISAPIALGVYGRGTPSHAGARLGEGVSAVRELVKRIIEI